MWQRKTAGVTHAYLPGRSSDLLHNLTFSFIFFVFSVLTFLTRLDFQCPCFSAEHKPEKLPNLFPWTGAYAGLHRWQVIKAMWQLFVCVFMPQLPIKGRSPLKRMVKIRHSEVGNLMLSPDYWQKWVKCDSWQFYIKNQIKSLASIA